MTGNGKTNEQVLWEKISQIKVAMLVSVTPEGGYHSRPMMTAQNDFDGRLYFFTSKTSPKVDEVLNEPKVLLNYSGPDDSVYVSVYGNAKVVTDPVKIDEHWSPALNAFFKEGRNDPLICLMEIEVEKAEYWDSSQSKMTQIYEMVKSSFTDEKPNLGEHKVMNLVKKGHSKDENDKFRR